MVFWSVRSDPVDGRFTDSGELETACSFERVLGGMSGLEGGERRKEFLRMPSGWLDVDFLGEKKVVGYTLRPLEGRGGVWHVCWKELGHVWVCA